MQIQPYQQRVNISGTGDLPYASDLPAASGQAAVGQAEQQLGNTISSTAGLLNDTQIMLDRQARRQAEETASIWTAKATSDARLAWTQKINEIQNTATGAGTDLAKNGLRDFDDYAKQTIANAPDDISKKMLQQQLVNLRTQVGTSLLETQNKQHIMYNVNQLQDTINANASIAAIDPNQAPVVYASTLQAIDKLDIPDDQKYGLRDQMRKQMVTAYADNQIINNPEGFKNQLNPSVGQLPEGSVEASIADAAKAAGVDPLVALAIAESESSISTSKNPAMAKNTESSAYGVYQMVDKTWAQYGKGDRADQSAQIQAGINLIKDNTNSLRGTLGREPTPNEVYLAHVFGAGGASDLLHADKNTPINQVISADAIKANKLTGTAGDVINKFSNKVDSKLSKFTSSEQQAARPFIQNIMTTQEKFSYYHQANQAAQQQMATKAVNINQTIADHEAQALAGFPPARPLTSVDFDAAHPNDPLAARIAEDKYNNTVQTGYRISQFANQTPEQTNAIIQAATPRPDEPGYEYKSKLQSTMIEAQAQKMKQLTADPQAFVSSHNPLVNSAGQAYASNPTPENMQAYFSSSIAAQQAQGIRYPQLLTKGQESQLIQTLTKSSGEVVAKTLNQVSAQYGAYWPQVYGQLAKNENTPSAVLVIPTVLDSNTQIQLGNLANIKAIDLAKNIDSNDAKLIGAQIAEALEPFRNSLEMSANNQKTIDAFNENITKLAYTYVQQRFKPKDAALTAYKRVMGDSHSFIDNKVSATPMRIPVAEQPELVADGAAEFVKTLANKAQDLELPIGSKGEDYIAYGAQLKNSPIWITNENGSGLKLYTQGSNNTTVPVKYKNGAQVEVSFSQMRDIGSKDKVSAMQKYQEQQQLQNLRVLRSR